MYLLRLGPQARAERQPAGPSHEPGRRWRGAAVGSLWTLGVLCEFPQGVVPVALNPLAIWWAETIRRRAPEAP